MPASLRRVNGVLIAVVDQPAVQEAGAVMGADRGGGGLHSDRGQAGVSHAAHRRAADYGRDANHGLPAHGVGDAGHRQDDADADDRIRRRQQDEIGRGDRLEHAWSRR